MKPEFYQIMVFMMLAHQVDNFMVEIEKKKKKKKKKRRFQRRPYPQTINCHLGKLEPL